MKLLETMHKNLEPLKITFTWIWLVKWPDKKKARRRFLSKPLKNVGRAMIEGKLKTMRLILLK